MTPLNGDWKRLAFSGVRKLLKMERETGIEPATNSLEEQPRIVNKENSVYGADSTTPKPPKILHSKTSDA